MIVYNDPNWTFLTKNIHEKSYLILYLVFLVIIFTLEIVYYQQTNEMSC